MFLTLNMAYGIFKINSSLSVLAALPFYWIDANRRDHRRLNGMEAGKGEAGG